MRIQLKQVKAPKFDFTDEIPPIPVEVYKQRINTLYEAAETDWVVVYGDREHYANLTFLINFDPRFEETLFLIGPNGAYKLVVGNEDMGYGSVLPFPVEMLLAQSLSLSGQQRDTAPRLVDVLANAGIGPGQSVSMVGWKYLEPYESDTPSAPAFVPAFFVDAVRSLVGSGGRVVDGTALMMHPEHGLRAANTPDQIAVFEAAARNCSAAVFRILAGTRPGMTEMDAVRLMNYAGAPMSMHPIFASGSGEINGLRSATGRVIDYGDGVSTAMGYWGSLVCRAGMMLGEVDQGFFDHTVAPYFNVIATWYQTMRVGITGGEVSQAVAGAFEGTGMCSLLNPGHLISYDEWVHSPIRPGSPEKIRSGMVFQADIIPTPLQTGKSLNCEDTIAIADESLRAEIRAAYPDLWARIQNRRDHMRTGLGIQMDESILPLTDGTAYLPPFWLLPDLVCTVERSQ
jgi:hypothetical protein